MRDHAPSDGEFLCDRLTGIRGLLVALLIALPWGGVQGSVLVLAPHPDDDILIASGVVHAALRRGEDVVVVYMTNGDKSGVPVGLRRQAEAVSSQSLVAGTNEGQLVFLGYPDNYLQTIFGSYTRAEDRFVAPNGQGSTYGIRGLGRTDFHSHWFGTPANYNLPNIIADLKALLWLYRPEQIFVTAEFDRHSDHSATYGMLNRALREVLDEDHSYNPQVHKTIVWCSDTTSWPLATDAAKYFTEPPGLSSTGVSWGDRQSLDVPQSMQVTSLDANLKYQAILAHQSQAALFGFLTRFVHKDEFFWTENPRGGDRPPIADAGRDIAVGPGQLVMLDGAGSKDPDGRSLDFNWSQASGYPVDLLEQASASPTFVAPVGLSHDASLTFRLVVRDGRFSSPPDHVTVRVIGGAQPAATNVAPAAIAVASSENPVTGQIAGKAVDQVISGHPIDSAREWATLRQGPGAWIRLSWPEPQVVDRIVLYDRPNLNDQVLSGTLTFSDGTEVSVGALSNSGGPVMVSFSARATRSVTFTVTKVSSKTVNIGLAEIQIFSPGASNIAPVAAPGDEIVVVAGAAVHLDGTASFDPEGLILDYDWEQVGGEGVSVTNRRSARPSFASPVGITEEALLRFRLLVHDGMAASEPRFVSVRVLPNLGEPVALTGPHQVTISGSSVTLDGTRSYDPEGSELTFQWTQMSGPPVTLNGARAARPAFVAPSGLSSATELAFQLVVADGQLSSAPTIATVTVHPTTVNIAPLAAAVASSENAVTGQLAVKAIDGVISGYPVDSSKEWATVKQGAGAWIQLSWPSERLVNRVVLFDRPNSNDQVVAGVLIFSDGLEVNIGALNNAGGPTAVAFSARYASSVTFRVTSVSKNTQNVGLAEMQVYGIP